MTTLSDDALRHLLALRTGGTPGKWASGTVGVFSDDGPYVVRDAGDGNSPSRDDRVLIVAAVNAAAPMAAELLRRRESEEAQLDRIKELEQEVHALGPQEVAKRIKGLAAERDTARASLAYETGLRERAVAERDAARADLARAVGFRDAFEAQATGLFDRCTRLEADLARAVSVQRVAVAEGARLRAALIALAAKWRTEADGGAHLYDSENFRGGGLRYCADDVAALEGRDE